MGVYSAYIEEIPMAPIPNNHECDRVKAIAATPVRGFRKRLELLTGKKVLYGIRGFDRKPGQSPKIVLLTGGERVPRETIDKVWGEFYRDDRIRKRLIQDLIEPCAGLCIAQVLRDGETIAVPICGLAVAEMAAQALEPVIVEEAQ
jgi:hypothetical protein